MWRPLEIRPPRAVLLGFLAVASWGLAGAGCDGPAPAETAAPPTAPAASAAPVEEAPRTLWLTADVAREGRVGAVLRYARRADQVAPRMMEVRVVYGPGLRFVAAQALDALTQAGKRLVAQDAPAAGAGGDAGGGEVRLVAFASSNLATLEPGPLARLVFEPVGGERTVRLRAQMPIFAPQAANRGVLLGGGVTLDGAGDAPSVERGGRP